MFLNINGKECELNFGIGFVRDLDNKYFVQNASGVKFGNGLETRLPMLLTGDVVTLAEFIKFGTARLEKNHPTEKEIDDYIDEAEDIETLFDEVLDELKKSNATKMKAKESELSLKKVEMELEELKKRGR